MIEKMNPEGWLDSLKIKKCPSPFFNERPLDVDINLLVIHCISLPEGQYGNGFIEQLFLGKLNPEIHPSFESLRELKVSAHLVIDRLGQVTQFVPLLKRAWHAGVSSFRGQENCNDYSIGIELEGTDQSAFTDIQYQRLNQIISFIQRHFPGITADRIVGHSDIAPGRKQDPGAGFEWDKVQSR